MKLGPLIKLDKRNTPTSKKTEDDFILENCVVIAFSQIYDQFPAYGSRIPHAWSIKLTFSLIVTY